MEQAYERAFSTLGLSAGQTPFLKRTRVHESGATSLGLSLDGPAAALGSMYVLEASALGGLVVARAVSGQHGLGPSHGARYFVGWGERTGTLWREFRATLDAELGDADHLSDRACAAAVATFEALIDVFERHTPNAVADPSQ
ncbi:biliverdin-producing heme oxygenase [Tahibacter soli]|uniref:Biliverdin-producing heme oxygenase n=1 Tax=Tahibacter soli TaxID=2983605 RepID=A0A9X4BKL8_9GAMM|nr:biliverdin-producing heme oxygenase [Tahibacter soli]MDC8014397.1 biliverdin-producing heme oxygenase [Tahibacter soli]